MKIFKYLIPLPGIELDLPKGAGILSFQSQNNEPMIWVLLNEDNETEKRKFYIVGTGHPLRDEIVNDIYIGTVQIHGFVWHLFEDLNY